MRDDRTGPPVDAQPAPSATAARPGRRSRPHRLDAPVPALPPQGDPRHQAPGTSAEGEPPVPPTGPRRSRRTARRAGRNVPQSIAVGVALIAVLLASLYVERAAFVGLAAVAVLVAVWEIAGALRTRGVRVPVLPLGTGSVAMLVTAYTAGAGPLLGVLLVTCAAVLVWRAVDGPEGFVADATAGVFTAAYVPLLASFALLLLREHDGPDRIVAFILAVVGSDVGGFVTGVLWGRHPMVPRISPRKSWEGFAGSLVLGTGVGAAVVPWLLDGPAWGGALLGLAAVVTATAGDLAESLIKRDLGVKDMGSVLPGHGGVMDRLDSLLPTAPVAYLVLSHVLSR